MNKNRATRKYFQMHWKSKLLIFSVVFMLFLSFHLKAQTFEAGAFVGGAYYLGDFNPGNHFVESDLAYGGVLKYNFNKRLSLGLSATQANISSDATDFNSEHFTTYPNLSTQIKELAITGDFNFFPYAIGDKNNIWTPYIFGGAAYFLSDNINSVSIPFGIGIKVSPIDKIGLNLFWGARKTFTDDLDNVTAPTSTDYKGYNYDWYIFYGLNITFAFRLKKDTGCRNLINGRYY